MGKAYSSIPPPPDPWVVQRAQTYVPAPPPNRSLARGYFDAVLAALIIGGLAAALLHAVGLL